jgi:hypothetical protein
MARIELISSPYAGRSVISSGQECVNLYAEINVTLDPQAPAKTTYYPTAGTLLYANPNFVKKARGAYRTSLGTAFYVVGQNVYFLTANGVLIFIGAIADRESQVYFADNGLVCVLVDGVNGYVIDLPTNTLGIITDPNFYGADYVALLDTLFIFNRPKTNQFYISASNASYGLLTNTSLGGDGSITTPGTGGITGLYQGVALTGGSGTGATADIQVASGIIATGHISAAGSSYINGFYPAVPLTGGSGLGATADITVAGNAVTVVSFAGANDLFGSGYTVANVLTTPTANIGGGAGAGFTWTVDTIANGVGGVTIDNPGINYVPGDVLSAASASIGNVIGFTYTNQLNGSAFDPLDIAAKSGFNDPIVGIVAVHRELWLIGALTTEVWIGTGAADFYFQEQQGAYINHGCAAQYSIATMDVLTFFIMQDQQGNGIVVQGQGYDVTEISTPRIVSEFKKYTDLTDAIGFCFQIEEHPYYCLVFPTANKGWLYDLTTKQWCEWNYIDADGNFNRPRANCCMFVNGLNLIGDWESGCLLQLDINTFTDFTLANATTPITRVRTFPHSTDNNDKVTYQSFDADMEVGTITDDSEPFVSLSWSDNKGVSYGNPIQQSMGMIGEYLTTISWNRLGQARDRIFKLSWSTNNKTALNGGFLERKKART